MTAHVIRRVMAVLFGYIAACAAVLLLYQGFSGGPLTPVALASGMLLTLMLSLPGFALLRAALWWGRETSPVLFSLAGAVNGQVALSLFFQRPTGDAGFLAMGLAAGLVYWGTERWIARGLIRRAGVGTA